MAAYRQNAGGASSHVQGTEFMESGGPGFGDALAGSGMGETGLTNGVVCPAPMGKNLTPFVDNAVVPAIAMQDEEPVLPSSYWSCIV